MQKKSSNKSSGPGKHLKTLSGAVLFLSGGAPGSIYLKYWGKDFRMVARFSVYRCICRAAMVRAAAVSFASMAFSRLVWSSKIASAGRQRKLSIVVRSK